MKTQPLMGFVGAVALLSLTGLASTSASEVFVPLGEDNKILVIDTQTDAVIREINVLPNVHGLAGTTDGRLLVAGSLDERAASAPGPKKPAGVSPEDHEAQHSVRPARARIPGAFVSTVSIFRKSNGDVFRHIDVTGAVHHVAVSPNDRIAAVTHPGEGTVTLIDLEKFKVIQTIATGLGPNYAVFDPTSKHLYVSNAGDGTISDIEIRTLSVHRAMPVGKSPEHIVLSNDGATLYVNNVNDGTISVLSQATGNVVRIIAVGDYTHSVGLSEDGRTLFVSDRGNDRLMAIDVESTSQKSVSLIPSPYHIAVLRGEGKLYVSSADEPKIWVIDQKSLKVTGEIFIGGRGHQMVVLPKT